MLKKLKTLGYWGVRTAVLLLGAYYVISGADANQLATVIAGIFISVVRFA